MAGSTPPHPTSPSWPGLNKPATRRGVHPPAFRAPPPAPLARPRCSSSFLPFRELSAWGFSLAWKEAAPYGSSTRPTPRGGHPYPRAYPRPRWHARPWSRPGPALLLPRGGELMAWENSDRKARLPRDWSTRRVRVLRRDGYKCQARDSTGALCAAPANQVDHVEHGDNHDLSNLQALCRWHHARKSSREGVAARRPRQGQARPPEPHPGLL